MTLPVIDCMDTADLETMLTTRRAELAVWTDLYAERYGRRVDLERVCDDDVHYQEILTALTAGQPAGNLARTLAGGQ